MCRLCSKVITVSDISDPRGTHIPWRKISGDWKANSTLQLWPTMPKPPRDYWSTYRSFIRKAFCKNENHTAPRVSLTLDTKLGTWHNVPRHIIHDHFRTQRNPYSRESDHYVRYTPSGIRQVWTRSSSNSTLSSHAHPIHTMANEYDMFT